VISRRKVLLLLPGIAVSQALGCKRETAQGGAPAGSGAAKPNLRIAVIPKGTTHEFWKSVHAGAIKAARELQIEIVYKGPLKEDDLKQQIDLVQSFTAQGVAGIVLAPLNDKALVGSVRAATGTGIPVVIFDSDLQGDAHQAFVATDNRVAGRLAGERMAKLLDGKGGVLLLRYQEGSASTHHREEGFLEAVRAHPGLQVLSDNQYGGATTETAFSASENLLAAKSAATGAVKGVFCPNESTTFGMLLALEKSKLAGKVKFIGFDASEKLVQALKASSIDALVLQNPFNMGYVATKTLVSHLRGEKVEKRIDTGSKVVDRENMEQPEVRELLKPDLEKWLGKAG
jgi:ribose transport system substrate-binding protein